MKYSLLFIVVLGFVSTSPAAVIPVVWDSSTKGEFHENPLTLLDTTDPELVKRDLSGPDFAAAPLSTQQIVVEYQARDDWMLTLDRPVSSLYLYADNWRATNYVFDRPFTVLSGLPFSTVSDTTLSWIGPNRSGLLRFSGPFTTLSVDSGASSAEFSLQQITFAVPEPASAVLAMIAAGLFATRRRHSSGIALAEASL